MTAELFKGVRGRGCDSGDLAVAILGGGMAGY